MSTFFGIINKDSSPVDPNIVKSACKSMSNWDSEDSDTLIIENIAFGNWILRTTPESINEQLPYFDEVTGCLIVADARIDYRKELVVKLDESWEENQEKPDSFLILKSYLKWGKQCVNYLYGDFAFAIWDNRSKKLFCARDHFGIRPFYYTDQPSFFAFSTEIQSLFRIPGMVCQVDDEFLIDGLIAVFPEKERSPFVSIKKLEPSHILLTSLKGSVLNERYWDLKQTELFDNITEEDAIRGFKERLENSVNERIRSIVPIGAELSGGLDSSGIVSIASSRIKSMGIKFSAYSHTLDDKFQKKYYPFIDETKYSKIAAENAKIELHRFISCEGKGCHEAIEGALKISPQPFSTLYSMFATCLYEDAQMDGVNILLSGFGGDEGVTYSASGYLKELVAKKKMRELKFQLRKDIELNGGSYFLRLSRYYILRYIPVLYKIEYLFSRKRNFQRKYYHFNPLINELKIKFQTQKRFRSVKRISERNIINERIYNKLMYNHIHNRLENTNLIAQSYKLEYRYPMLDIKLLEFYYSLPSNLKFNNGINRYIYRQVMRDYIPEEIRSRKDFMAVTIPNILYRLGIDEMNIKETIDEGKRNNSFHYVDYKKLEELVEGLKMLNNGGKLRFGPEFIYRSIAVLILQKWQRERKIDIGIKC